MPEYLEGGGYLRCSSFHLVVIDNKRLDRSATPRSTSPPSSGSPMDSQKRPHHLSRPLTMIDIHTHAGKPPPKLLR